jgi:hypothetical protein
VFEFENRVLREIFGSKGEAGNKCGVLIIYYLVDKIIKMR